MSNNKKVIASQDIEIYGEIVKGGTREWTSKKGDAMKTYQFTVREKDSGFNILCEKIRNMTKPISEAQEGFFEGLDNLLGRVRNLTDGKGIKSKTKFYPKKGRNDEYIQWSWLTVDELADGGLITKISATPYVMDTPKAEFEYDEAESYARVKMILEDVDTTQDKLKFSDGGLDYPNYLHAFLIGESAENIHKYEIGTGYQIALGFKKGEKISSKVGEFSFEKEESGKYEPNKLVVLSTSVVNGLSADSGSISDSDFPF